MSNVGDLIRGRRLNAGLSQTALAKRVEIDRSYLSQIESGRIKWAASVIYRLADELGIDQEGLQVARLRDLGEESKTGEADDEKLARYIDNMLAIFGREGTSREVMIMLAATAATSAATTKDPDERRRWSRLMIQMEDLGGFRTLDYFTDDGFQLSLAANPEYSLSVSFRPRSDVDESTQNQGEGRSAEDENFVPDPEG